MRSVDVNQVVDDAKFTPFHMNVLFWCMLVIIFDGYDLVIYGVAMKGLVAQWGLSAKEAGFLGSVALFGMMIGAMLVNKFSKPTYIIQQSQPQSQTQQPPINYGQR